MGVMNYCLFPNDYNTRTEQMALDTQEVVGT